MGFLKKLVKGVGKLAKNVIKPAVGFAAKIVGGANIPLVSGGANLVGKLVKSIPTGGKSTSTKNVKKAGAAGAASLKAKDVTDVLKDVSKAASAGDWFKKNWYWVVFPPVVLFGLIMLIFKRK